MASSLRSISQRHLTQYGLERALFASKKGWAIYESEQRVKAEATNSPLHTRIYTAITDRPLLAAGTAHILVLALVAVGFQSNRSFLSWLAPTRPQEVLATAWQVHAGFVAIAFAGLAMLIDMAGRESLVRAVVERRYLIRRTQFSLAFFYSLAGAVQLGVVSTWFPTPGTVVVELLLVVSPSVLLIGFAYARAIQALTDPAAADETAAGVMLDELRISLDASRALTLAEERIAELAPLHYGVPNEEVHELVIAKANGRLLDVHLPSLEFVARGMQSAATTAEIIMPGAAPALSTAAPELRRRALLGNLVQEGDPIFVVVGGVPSDQDLRSFSRSLSNAIHWESA